MRDFTKIHIDEKLGNREFYGMEKMGKIVDQSLLEIFNTVMTQDKDITKGMPPKELETYMNVEVYFCLNDYIHWLDEEKMELHTQHDCPICAEKHRVIYLIESLIKRWTMQGKRKQFEEAARFRAYAMDKGRIVN